MLHRAYLSSVSSVHPTVETEAASAVLTAPASRLLRFLFGLALVSGLTLIYVWQTSTVTSVQQQTIKLQATSVDLERQNVALMLEVAAWNQPEYIEKRALALGMAPVVSPAYVQAPVATPAAGRPAPATDDLATWWERTTTPILERLHLTAAPTDPAQLLGLR